MMALANLGMASFGLLAAWIAFGPLDSPWRRWAGVIGLCGQPLWALFAWNAHQQGVEVRGLAVVIVAFTVVYLRGIVLAWWRR